MNKITQYFLMLIMTSCASYMGHNRLDKMNVTFKGGMYENKTWDNPLVFRRTSYFQGSKLVHDVLITRLEKSSNFYRWLGDQTSQFSDCNELYITLLYKDLNAIYGTPLSIVKDQLARSGLIEYVIQDFNYAIRQHYAFEQWVLTDHKVYAYCNRSDSLDKIYLSMPGFRKTNLLQ